MDQRMLLSQQDYQPVGSLGEYLTSTYNVWTLCSTKPTLKNLPPSIQTTPIKQVVRIFLFPSAYKSYVFALPWSIKCTVALSRTMYTS